MSQKESGKCHSGLEWLVSSIFLIGWRRNLISQKSFLRECFGRFVLPFFLVIIYIFFQHNFDSLIRRLDKTESEIKEKRAAYISHKSSYMFESKHSQVSKALEERGLNRNIEPPIKIVTED